ncbi:MAG: DUF885 domain-containing protein, partial [Alphaproteobacteria bacterium]|nr:DUF885 domain-containing protein [Alphaproteobacteria bacterium]
MRFAVALMLLPFLPFPPIAAPAFAQTAPQAGVQDEALLQFLDGAFDERLALSPESQTRLGLKTDYNKLDDYTDAASVRTQAMAERQLTDMRARFQPERLGESARVSYRLFEYEVERSRASARFRKLRFPVSTNGSPAGAIPVLLINNHKVDTVADAEAYIARLRDTDRVMREVATTMREQAAAGIIPNKVNFAPARADALKVITGAPFDNGEDSTLMADFRKKVEALDAAAAVKAKLLADARAALTGPFRQGYRALVAAIDEIEPQSKGNFGAWNLPDGAAYYADRLQSSTTTSLTADQIHDLGLAQVAAIRQEMEAIKREVGFTGTLEQFFDHIRTDPQFKYPNTEAGREAYLADARAVIAAAMTAAPCYFRVLPKAALEVRAVEKWREATASTAFYNSPSADGTRPGIYYVNLVDMNQTQKVQVAGIAAHEGAPGHHFQIARQQELTGIPKFRKFGGYGAYMEGWGLYSERLANEMGVYKTPYDRFGMLSLQVWRAIRLVLDSGIHSKRWTREQAIAFRTGNYMVDEHGLTGILDWEFAG